MAEGSNATAPAMLVSDIDDTLIGDRDGLTKLKVWLREHPGTLFAVATGRHLPVALRLIGEWQAPSPRYLITAVGSEIHQRRGEDLVPDLEWRDAISVGWDAAAVDRLLGDLPGITPQGQECQSPVKRSYFVQSGGVASDVRERLRRKGIAATVIWSHGQFLDVLPERASKGQALAFLAAKLGVGLNEVFAAGDSGNDEDLLTTAGSSVVVRSDRAELDGLRGREGVHFSDLRGAAGIMDGLERWQGPA
ncbi:HAD-IIB family hydrolase [Parvularcula maris]|uniref:HAD family hydrolase n=1 Tax=Parvularcula maris TaxID=2965077 RepID=A0A9X2L7M1_9PROT|nr:HAD-IIB family hydrolase [Parvularcula maris]MCQ8184453.1 HAD family hydrolase [Parvularcula maris]